MKRAKVFFTALAFMIFTSAFSQQAFRGDICQSIPGLSSEQQQKIDKLGLTHQKKMDALRTKFLSESNAENAANLKSQMNSEMQNHYQNITALLTPEQQSWYEQNCNANSNRNYYARAGYGQNYGRGQGAGRGPGYTVGAGYGRGTGFGRGAGYRRGAGNGWGTGYGKRAACGRGRIVN
jgi:hypothetical protein